MHYNIIILTNNNQIKALNLENSLILNDKNIEIIDDFSLKYNDNLLFFDYLIVDSYSKNLNLINDNNKYITNCYHQTSTDNIFAIGESSFSTKDLLLQLNEILDFIYNE